MSRAKLETYLVGLLSEHGPLNFERICPLCGKWRSPKYIVWTLNTLIDARLIHTQYVAGQKLYCAGPPLEPAPQKPAEVGHETGTDQHEELQADILAMLARGESSEDLLRDRLCVASRLRFARAIRALLRSRLIRGDARQYRLAGEPKAQGFSSIDSARRGRAAS